MRATTADKASAAGKDRKVLIERESARQLASLGGSMPGLRNIPRRRSRKNNR